MSIVVRARKASNRFRESLFYLPAVFVLASIALAQTMLTIDSRIDVDRLPTFLRFTVDSARELLSTVAGATITVAGIVFALTALTVQLASSQFSPRVVRGFLRDRFQQQAIGFMVGTFTYSLLVLRAIRTPTGDGDEDIVPNLSAGLALVFAIIAVITILGYVNHTAHSLQASELIRRVTDETTALARKRFAEEPDDDPAPAAPPRPVGPSRRICSTDTGWVQQVSNETLTKTLPPGAVVQVDVRVGDFVHEGGRLCAVWANDVDADELLECVNKAVVLGHTRTMQQDVAFGIRQLVDIALRALSTGVNDPTTAYECIVHLGAVLHEVLGRELPHRIMVDDQQRWVLRPEEPGYDSFVQSAFEEIRVNVVDNPHLTCGLIDVLGTLVREMDDIGHPERAEGLRRQIELLVEGVEAASPLPADVERVRRAADVALAGERTAAGS